MTEIIRLMNKNGYKFFSKMSFDNLKGHHENICGRHGHQGVALALVALLNIKATVQ